jgi:CheY-like chemotaxis protein
VLVVDDDPLNRKLTTLRLRDAGFEVETANTAEAALHLAASAPPEAILSDVQMPGMSGFELRRAILADATLARIPVILISSACREASRAQPENAGVECIPRTSDLREAIAALTAALRD